MFDQNQEIKNERMRDLRLFPVIIFFVIAVVLIIIFLGSDDFIYSHQEMPGITKHACLLATVVLLGCATLCWLATICNLILLYFISKRSALNINYQKALKLYAALAAFGIFFIWLYYFVIDLIKNNSKWLNDAFYFGDYKQDFLWDMGVTIITVFLLLIFSVLAFVILSIPATASNVVLKTDD